MKRTLLSAALTLSLTLPGSLVFAQQTGPAQQTTPDSQQTPSSAQQWGRHRHFHHPDAQRETARLTRQLNLSSDQSAKLEPILADRDQKMADLWSNQSLAPQDRREQMRAIQQSTRQQLESVLTPAQIEQMKSMHHGHRGGANQTQPANPSPGA